jgi:hypothetical protein
MEIIRTFFRQEGDSQDFHNEVDLKELNGSGKTKNHSGFNYHPKHPIETSAQTLLQ